MRKWEGSAVTPLFVCHANCSRSMIAVHLYREIAKAPALSAGMEVGEQPAARSVEMLGFWEIDASAHRPRQIDRAICDEAGAIFVMAAPYLRRLLIEYGEDLGARSYLFADPFTRPLSFANREYAVNDPTWDDRPASVLCAEHDWMRDRVIEIDEALKGRGRPLVAADSYLDVLASVDPKSH
jgi:protein-tyrosine-phosphatase